MSCGCKTRLPVDVADAPIIARAKASGDEPALAAALERHMQAEEEMIIPRLPLNLQVQALRDHAELRRYTSLGRMPPDGLLAEHSGWEDTWFRVYGFTQPKEA